MARLILDTTVLVELERDGQYLDEALPDDANVAMATISLAELLVGTELGDGGRARQRRHFIQGLGEVIDTVDYTPVIANAHAKLLAHARRTGQPRGAHDLIIAATAIATQRTLLSTDDRARFGELPGLAFQLVGAWH